MIGYLDNTRSIWTNNVAWWRVGTISDDRGWLEVCSHGESLLLITWTVAPCQDPATSVSSLDRHTLIQECQMATYAVAQRYHLTSYVCSESLSRLKRRHWCARWSARSFGHPFTDWQRLLIGNILQVRLMVAGMKRITQSSFNNVIRLNISTGSESRLRVCDRLGRRGRRPANQHPPPWTCSPRLWLRT